MPIYQAHIEDMDEPKIIRADTAAQAKSHLVKLKSISATQLADLVASGAVIETAEKE